MMHTGVCVCVCVSMHPRIVCVPSASPHTGRSPSTTVRWIIVLDIYSVYQSPIYPAMDVYIPSDGYADETGSYDCTRCPHQENRIDQRQERLSPLHDRANHSRRCPPQL